MKSYKQFIKESNDDAYQRIVNSFVNKDSIQKICNEYRIKNYTINDDGSVDVKGDVYLSFRDLKEIPLKFGKISGSFYCNNNQLRSLQGCPTTVGDHFSCSRNRLDSLNGSPEKVGGFNCAYNQLTSLVGCPGEVGYFDCRDNEIYDFRGISEFFEDEFYCETNPIKEIWSLFEDVRCIKLINEFDVIRGNFNRHTVVMDRLEEVFHQLGMDIPENIDLPSYEII